MTNQTIDLGDGSAALVNLASPMPFNYEQPGTYQAKLTASNEFGTDEMTITVNIEAVEEKPSGNSQGTIIEHQAEVSGVWTKEGSPYKLFGDTSVPVGKTLEIKPGVRVVHTGGNITGNLHVAGRLTATGTEKEPVSIRKLKLRFDETRDGNLLEHVSADDSELYLNNANIRIVNARS